VWDKREYKGPLRRQNRKSDAQPQGGAANPALRQIRGRAQGAPDELDLGPDTVRATATRAFSDIHLRAGRAAQTRQGLMLLRRGAASMEDCKPSRPRGSCFRCTHRVQAHGKYSTSQLLYEFSSGRTTGTRPLDGVGAQPPPWGNVAATPLSADYKGDLSSATPPPHPRALRKISVPGRLGRRHMERGAGRNVICRAPVGPTSTNQLRLWAETRYPEGTMGPGDGPRSRLMAMPWRGGGAGAAWDGAMREADGARARRGPNRQR